MGQMAKTKESQEIEMLFQLLLTQPKYSFPAPRQPLPVPTTHGVYIIHKGEDVLHVGRTIRGRKGLRQRLNNHLQGSSSFTEAYLKGNGSRLRDRYHTYQYLEVPDPRKRALLEALTIGKLCPQHIGVGIEK